MSRREEPDIEEGYSVVSNGLLRQRLVVSRQKHVDESATGCSEFGRLSHHIYGHQLTLGQHNVFLSLVCSSWHVYFFSSSGSISNLLNSKY